MTELWPGFESEVLVELMIAGCLLTLTEARNGLPAGHTILEGVTGQLGGGGSGS